MTSIPLSRRSSLRWPSANPRNFWREAMMTAPSQRGAHRNGSLHAESGGVSIMMTSKSCFWACSQLASSAEVRTRVGSFVLVFPAGTNQTSPRRVWQGLARSSWSSPAVSAWKIAVRLRCRRSPSISKTFRGTSASAGARLRQVVDFPSPSHVLVTRRILRPEVICLNMFVRAVRIASAYSESGFVQYRDRSKGNEVTQKGFSGPSLKPAVI